jgi:hypothetical protein
MASTHRGVTGCYTVESFEPLTVTVAKACELSGFGPTSIWAFLKDRRWEAVRVDGVRRTLISYQSLMKLLASDEASSHERRSLRRKAVPGARAR